MTKTINRKVRNYRKDHQKLVREKKLSIPKAKSVSNKQPLSKKQLKKLQQALRRQQEQKERKLELLSSSLSMQVDDTAFSNNEKDIEMENIQIKSIGTTLGKPSA